MLDKTYRPGEVEDEHYAAWEESGAFAADPASNAQPYTIMMPPPNVTGSLHMGHALNNTLAGHPDPLSAHARRDALWQPGTDHAGIATQMVVERELADEGKTSRTTSAARTSSTGSGNGRPNRRHDHPPAPPAGRLARLGARALHHGRGPVRGRAQGVRHALQARA